MMSRTAIAAAVAFALCCQGAVAQEASPRKQEGDAAAKRLPFPKKFDPSRYLGKWYEVARLPTPAQPAGTLATAEYAAGKNEGEIIVKNTAYTDAGKLIATIEGKAQLLPDDPPRLVVSFGPVVPKEPNYFVIHVDENYQHAVVGTPDRKSLWILTRKIPLPQETRDSLVAIAKEAGFDTQKIFVDDWKAGSLGSGPRDRTNEQSKEQVAVAFKRLYRLNITVMQTNNAIVQTIQGKATAGQAAQNVRKLFPLKAEIRFLERALREFGTGLEQQLYDEYKLERDKLSAAYVKLAVQVKDQPYFDTFNTAFVETSRETTSLKPYSIPEGHAQRCDGPQFVIWLPAGATPEIDLSREKGTLEVFVVDEQTGELYPQRQTITCGGKALLPLPDRRDGSLYWLRPAKENNARDSDTNR